MNSEMNSKIKITLNFLQRIRNIVRCLGLRVDKCNEFIIKRKGMADTGSAQVVVSLQLWNRMETVHRISLKFDTKKYTE